MRALFVVAAMALGACSGYQPECSAIVQRCRDAFSTATQQECVDNASRVWTASQCASNLMRCETACVARAGDGGP